MASSHSAPLAPDRSAWPRISVVLPNYNHCHFLKISLPALLNQSYPPYEIVVVDDGSKDDSVAYLEAMQEKHPTIRLFRHEKNQGVVAAINTGLLQISGGAVYLAGADDEVYPGFFEEAARMLAAYPEAGFFCSDGDVFHEREQLLETHRLGLAGQPAFFTPENFLRRIRQLPNFYFESHTILSSRKALAAAGTLDPQLGYRSDWFVNWVNVARHGCCYSPRVLAKFLDRGSNFSVATAQDLAANKRIWRSILAKLRNPAYQDVRPFILDPAQYAGDLQLTSNLLALLITDPANRVMLRPRFVWAWLRQLSLRILGFLVRNLAPARLKEDAFSLSRFVGWRACWLASSLIGRLAPRQTNTLRLRVWTWFGAQMAPGCWIAPTAWSRRPWKLRFGKCVQLLAGVKICASGLVSIGDHTVVEPAVEFPRGFPQAIPRPVSPKASIVLGAHCRIGTRARIYPGSTVPPSTHVRPSATVSSQGVT